MSTPPIHTYNGDIKIYPAIPGRSPRNATITIKVNSTGHWNYAHIDVAMAEQIINDLDQIISEVLDT